MGRLAPTGAGKSTPSGRLCNKLDFTFECFFFFSPFLVVSFFLPRADKPLRDEFDQGISEDDRESVNVRKNKLKLVLSGLNIFHSFCCCCKIQIFSGDLQYFLNIILQEQRKTTAKFLNMYCNDPFPNSDGFSKNLTKKYSEFISVDDSQY